MKDTRLDKFLSDNTNFTRSELKRLIRSGKASVNGKIIKSPEYKIDTADDNVSLCSNDILSRKFVYILMNKPAGIISASNDKSRKTVVDIVPDEFKHYQLFPVGRLDKDTTGLLLITNNGEYAHKVISPKNLIEKSYIAEVDNPIPNDISDKFEKGIVLVDGTVCKPAVAKIISENTVKIIITEGKYHQIKRMLGTLGLGVNKLHRERIGELTLPENLLTGQSIEIDEKTALKVFNRS